MIHPAVPFPGRKHRWLPAPPPEWTRRLRPDRRFLFHLGLLLLSLGVLALAADQAIRRDIRSATEGYLYSSTHDAPSRPVALVFGAGYRRGVPTPVLYDRLRTAADLYHTGKVRKILVTGDNGSLYYNEVAVMRRTLMRMGVPGGDVIKDHAGFRTYDSCYRARDVFGVRSAVLVTQAFHLPRAVYLARRMGIDAVGVKADRQPYSRETSYRVREWLACSWSWVELNVTHPKPRFLGPKVPLFSRVASAHSSGVLIP
jgi:vancomycin permeability regulator SanA